MSHPDQRDINAVACCSPILEDRVNSYKTTPYFRGFFILLDNLKREIEKLNLSSQAYKNSYAVGFFQYGRKATGLYIKPILFFFYFILLTSVVKKTDASDINLRIQQIILSACFSLIALFYRINMSINFKSGGAIVAAHIALQILNGKEIKLHEIGTTFVLTMLTYYLIEYTRWNRESVNQANQRIARQAIDTKASVELQQLIRQFPFLSEIKNPENNQPLLQLENRPTFGKVESLLNKIKVEILPRAKRELERLNDLHKGDPWYRLNLAEIDDHNIKVLLQSLLDRMEQKNNADDSQPTLRLAGI